MEMDKYQFISVHSIFDLIFCILHTILVVERERERERKLK